MRKPLFGFLMGIIPCIVFGQIKDQKTMVGFAIGTNIVSHVESKPGLNFGAGIYYFPHNFVGVSFQPGMALSEFKPPNYPRFVETAQFEMPLHLVLRAGKGVIKPLIEAGPDWILDVSGANNPSMIGWDLAAGLEMSNGMLKIKRDITNFSIMPQIRYSFLPDRRVIYFTLHFLG